MSHKEVREKDVDFKKWYFKISPKWDTQNEKQKEEYIKSIKDLLGSKDK